MCKIHTFKMNKYPNSNENLYNRKTMYGLQKTTNSQDTKQTTKLIKHGKLINNIKNIDFSCVFIKCI